MNQFFCDQHHRSCRSMVADATSENVEKERSRGRIACHCTFIYSIYGSLKTSSFHSVVLGP